jgi:hypothetical protein
MEEFKDLLKIKIAVSGAAQTRVCSEDILEKCISLGKAIAKRNCVLITGATTGVPYWVAKGAKEVGGFVIGLSPALTYKEHIEIYQLPVDYHDIIIWTGLGYSGRNMILSRSAEAIIFVCGRVGTLNEFTTAFEDNKIMGILKGSGGTESLLPDILKKAQREERIIVWESDPEILVDKLIEKIKEKI